METKKNRLKEALEEIFGNSYEKSPMWKNFENYEKNVRCIRDVTDKLISCMKGHGVSFRPEITDNKGEFSEEKLSALVEKILTLWEDRQREGTFVDPSTKESMAEPYIRDRRELYGLYLYLVMRCSLEKGGYALSGGGELKERTDFAFLLEQARGLLGRWCVLKCPDGSRRNEVLLGYDFQFGLHLYSALTTLREELDRAWDFPGREPLAFLTDEGNVKRNMLKGIYLGQMPAWAWKPLPTDAAQEEEAEEAGQEEAAKEEDGRDSEDECDLNDGCWYDYDLNDGLWYDPYDDLDEETKAAVREGEEERHQKMLDLEFMGSRFENPREYIRKCERFVERFRGAEAAVLRTFCDDLEEMVDLYLLDRGLPPLADTDKALDVYSRIYDEAFQQAKRYERGLKWQTMRA